MLKKTKSLHKIRERYATSLREPFFQLACDFLKDGDEIHLDIGAGDGKFAEFVQEKNSSVNLFLLDQNEDTISSLKKKYDDQKVIRYIVPTPIPFNNNTVSYIHCSHIIEHLNSDQLIQFFYECNRVLKKDGHLIFSSPLKWEGFYNDVTHVFPYGMQGIKTFFINDNKNFIHTNTPLEKGSYIVLKETYRFNNKSYHYYEGLGSKIFIIDLFIYLIKKIFYVLKIYNYQKTGYTLVLKKT